MYFFVAASYSASDIYSKPNAQRHKFMYWARVLVGEYAVGANGMQVPPTKPGTNDPYDTTVDNMQNPGVFVIFLDTQAYPEFLIEFS